MTTTRGLKARYPSSSQESAGHVGVDIWVGPGPSLFAPVERADRSYVIGLELEVEDLEVLLIRAGVVDLGKMTSPR